MDWWNSFLGYILQFTGASALIGFFSFWIATWASNRSNEKFKNNLLENLEDKKSINHKKINISKVKFDLEINAYKDIWARLSDLSVTMLSVPLNIDDYYEFSKMKKLQKDFGDSYENENNYIKTLECIESNALFLENNIYEELNIILGKYFKIFADSDKSVNENVDAVLILEEIFIINDRVKILKNTIREHLNNLELIK